MVAAEEAHARRRRRHGNLLIPNTMTEEKTELFCLFVELFSY